MAIFVSAHLLGKTYTSRPLFQGLTFSVETGDRIGLIGPNGAGKSTLLKILAGKTDTDSGTLSFQKGLRIGFLEQVPQFIGNKTVIDTIMEGAEDPHDWESISLAQELLSKLALNSNNQVSEESTVSSLSGGWKKRVALARELLKKPDLLLLDEPTNHLDIESILWLEEFLSEARFATITITHDRLFLQRISNRIIELDRRHSGGLLNVKGDYATYLSLREEALSAQATLESKMRNTLRRETEWLRRGAKARQTKQQARQQNAAVLKKEVEELSSRNRSQSLKIDFQSLEKNPKKLIEAKQISKSYNGVCVVPPIDLLITPNSRIGLIGPNGCGKSTLIKLLVGTEKADTGSLLHAERLEIAYFEQNRESLNPKDTVIKSVCPLGEFVYYAGKSLHVRSYLTRFLFQSEQMEMPVEKLSGGEQSRLLLARLMLRPANLLILDEPTNDLDITTLDVLEEVLKEFNGAIILVSHDRYFLDQVSNKLLAFGYDSSGQKQIIPMADVLQWETWNEMQKINIENKESSLSEVSNINDESQSVTGKFDGQDSAVSKKKKLSYKEQRELDGMEENILRAETRLAELTAESAKPDVVSNSLRLLELSQEMAKLQSEINRMYERWSELTS